MKWYEYFYPMNWSYKDRMGLVQVMAFIIIVGIIAVVAIQIG